MKIDLLNPKNKFDLSKKNLKGPLKNIFPQIAFKNETYISIPINLCMIIKSKFDLNSSLKCQRNKRKEIFLHPWIYKISGFSMVIDKDRLSVSRSS